MWKGTPASIVDGQVSLRLRQNLLCISVRQIQKLHSTERGIEELLAALYAVMHCLVDLYGLRQPNTQ
ncbi:hypothetical protein C7S18_16850 [Ahniella affigens]|uniref:Uncharacterized protein n=1 Tax=Ahniella affigens TaxID=2021234 RepID=A0A2P1PVE7_9GAMM|nr:hypothetical protein C7S18_16850 [Ahniella affigens]